jgi:hypothetical protein
MHSTLRGAVLVGAGGLGLIALSSLALAAPAAPAAKAGPAAPAAPAAPALPKPPATLGSLSASDQASLPGLVAALEGGDPDKATDAADQLGSLNAQAALEALLDALAMGPPPRVSFEILTALDPYHNPGEIDVLGLYTQNRNQEVRTKALDALAGIADARVAPYLLAALGDQVGSVRAEAATLVAERHDAGAEAKLLQLFEKGDPGAAVPLGQLATVSSASQLGDLLGQVPNDQLASCLGTMLMRPDFGPDTLKVEVVKLLGKIPGPDATAALRQYIQSLPPTSTLASLQEAQKAMEGR